MIVMNSILRNIPNTVTLINLTAGCVATALSFRGDTTLGSLPAWQWSCIFIAIAAVADFLDGFFARLLHAYSALGKELDSLSDLVSFGVAPAMLLMNVIGLHGAPEWMQWLTLAIPMGGALRLARFNVDTRQTTSFIGMPIPSNAIFWIGFCFMLYSGTDVLMNPVVFPAILIAECWLMISPLRLFSMKFKNYSWKDNAPRYVLAIALIIFICTMGVAGLMWFIIFYIILAQIPAARRLS